VAWLARTSAQGRRYAMGNQTEGSGYEAPTRWVADVAIRLAPHVHAVERARLLCAAALGYTITTPARFGLRPGTVAAPGTIKPCVALVHGTSRADKQWPEGSWVALGRQLNAAGFSVALAHGTPAEQVTSTRIAAQLADAVVWPTMGLDALTDTMAACAGVIGVDSGLSHIAVALDLPHVQIYNFDTAWRTGPLQTTATSPTGTARQVSVFAHPCPGVDAVWQAWQALGVGVR
jgi:heptosyltransferase-1